MAWQCIIYYHGNTQAIKWIRLYTHVLLLSLSKVTDTCRAILCPPLQKEVLLKWMGCLLSYVWRVTLCISEGKPISLIGCMRLIVDAFWLASSVELMITCGTKWGWYEEKQNDTLDMPLSLEFCISKSWLQKEQQY